MKSINFSLLKFFVFCLAVCGLVFGQTITTGDVAGDVTDQSGAAVPSANVMLKNLDSGETRTATTSGSGNYHFSLLKPGHYSVSSKAAGLLSDETNLSVQVGQVATVNLVEKVQSTQQVVEVGASADLVNSENADLSQTFSAEQMLQLPAPGGDITTVAFTVPGVVVSTGAGYGNFSSHGLPGTSNLYTINGNDYNDAYLNLNNSGASNLLLGQDEISEAAVTQNGYSVQYGRQAGAQVNYVTKSGTNRVHADLLFNFNNHLMNANDFFANSSGTARPYAVSRQWGADIGGPILKNKLFFFTDSEGLYYTLPSVHNVVVPTQQLETYILSNISPAQVPLYTKAFNVYNSAPGASNAGTIQTGSGPLQDSTGQLGCGALTGTATGTGGTFGVDTPCGKAFGASGLNTNKEWLMTQRVDWNINDKQKIFVRFKTDHGFQPTGTNLLSPQLNLVSIQPQYEGQINHTWVITPNLVNNAIVSVLWYSAIFGPANVSQSESVFPTYFTIGGAGGTNTAAFYPAGVNWNSFPQGRNVGQGQIIDDLSWTKGNHTLKFGVNFRKNRVTDFSYESNSVGTYNFANLVDFANGVTGSSALGTSYYQQKFSPLLDAHIRLYNIGVYVQDEWAIRSNLKLTAGIRFDRTANPQCLDKCFSLLNQPFNSSAFGTDPNQPYNQAINSGLSHAFYNVDSVVPDPRLGLVWSPRGNNSTVIRGGIGLFSDLAPGVLAASIFNNAPFPFQPQISSGVVDSASNPASAAAAAQAQYNAFKTGFFGGQTLSQLGTTLGGSFSPFPYFSVPKKLQTPNVIEWSFEVQQPIGTKNVFVATYSGNHGYNLLLQNGWLNAYNVGNIAFTGVPTAAPDSRFAAITQLTNQGYSNYDGASFQFRRAFSRGFQGEVSYTWSHALDVISNGGAGLPYSFCSGCGLTELSSPSVAANYGNADYDVRHNLSADFLYELPRVFGSNKLLGNAIGNWTVSGKVFWRTGTPFSVIDSALAGAVAGTNVSSGTTMLGSALTSNLPGTCGPSAVNTPCFNSSQFVASGSETTFGNLGRNAFYGPHYTDVDVSLFKNFNLKENVRLQLGASAYNIFNHPNFQNPSADIANPSSFGTIGSTAIPPTSAYGSFQGSAVSGRVLVVTGRFQF